MMPLTDNTQPVADDAFSLHKLWLAADPKAFVAEVGQGVRGILTNGIIGADGALIQALPKLEIVGVYGVGTDAVDLKTARARGVRVTNTPDVLTTGVAELALALLLDVARHVTANDRYLRAGRWVEEGDPPLAHALAGRRMGILGLGRIGQAVARRAAAFDMVLSYGGRSRKEGVDLPFHADPVALARVGRRADGHLHRRPDHRRPGQPRGDRGARARGLADQRRPRLGDRRAGPGRGAGAPASWVLPVSTCSRASRMCPKALLDLDHVVLQPHQASATVETRDAMGNLVLDNLKAHFAGQPLPTPVV